MGENVVLDGQATTAPPGVHHPTDRGATSNPLRVGLVGLDSMRRHHARIICVAEDMGLVVAVDPGGDRFDVADELPVPPDAHALVDAGLDATTVAAPTVYHRGVALALAEAGAYTMMEKPTAHDVAAGRRAIAAFTEWGLAGAVGYAERCNPTLRALRERLDAGESGKVYQALIRRRSLFLARISDVGVVKDSATHNIDLAAWIADARYTSVAMQVTHRSGRQNKDTMVAIGLLEGGIVVGRQANWFTPFKERVTIVTGKRGAFMADVLIGDLTFHTNDTVVSIWDQATISRSVSEGDVIRYAIPKREPLALGQENFRDAVCGVTQYYATMVEDAATLSVVEAALTSVIENRTAAL